jgi:nitrite reductase/ring-hydroxylating ferredoxin subunit
MTGPDPAWQRLAALDEIPARGLLFTFSDGPFESTGILVRGDAGVRAWRNQCRHLAVRLDRDTPGALFDRDGALLVCQYHGALYRPDDGVCVAGPCVGSRLRELPVTVLDGQVWLHTESVGLCLFDA